MTPSIPHFAFFSFPVSSALTVNLEAFQVLSFLHWDCSKMSPQLPRNTVPLLAMLVTPIKNYEYRVEVNFTIYRPGLCTLPFYL